MRRLPSRPLFSPDSFNAQSFLPSLTLVSFANQHYFLCCDKYIQCKHNLSPLQWTLQVTPHLNWPSFFRHHASSHISIHSISCCIISGLSQYVTTLPHLVTLLKTGETFQGNVNAQWNTKKNMLPSWNRSRQYAKGCLHSFCGCYAPFLYFSDHAQTIVSYNLRSQRHFPLKGGRTQSCTNGHVLQNYVMSWMAIDPACRKRCGKQEGDYFVSR